MGLPIPIARQEGGWARLSLPFLQQHALYARFRPTEAESGFLSYTTLTNEL